MKLRWAIILSVFFPGLVFAQYAPSSGFSSFSRRHERISISGIVGNASGAPVGNARVMVNDISSGITVASAYTNSSGNFEIDSLPEGNFEIVASSGVGQTSQRFDGISSGAFITLRLPRDASAAVGNPNGGTVSLADYKVPKKARDALRKSEEAAAKNKDEEAARYLNEALTIYPQYSDALTLRAIRSLTKDQDSSHAQALNDLDAAIKSDSSNARAYLVMGALYNSTQHFNDAVRVIQRGLSLTPAWQGYYELAKAYCGKADFADALRQLHRAEDGAPKAFTSLLLLKAHVLMAMKDYGNAASELHLFLASTPQGPQNAQALAMLQQVNALSGH